MNHSLRISEAASLALHSMVLLAARPDRPLSTREVAEELGVSEAHLSKVFQRLAKARLANSTRGPHGGFVLARDAHDISLLEVYETIDGPVGVCECLLDEPSCDGQACILGDLVKSINEQMRSYLSGTHLSDVTEVYARQRTSAVPA